MNGNSLGDRRVGKSIFGLGRSLSVDGMNWRGLIEDSALAGPIQATLISVVANSRLWKHEKFQVANELIAHFEDGIRRGRNETELVADFGDPLVAAKLIRVSKLRNRTMMSKLLSGGIWGSLALGLGYLGLTTFFYFGQANPGTDYLLDLNHQALLVPAEESAWLIYRDVFTRFEYSEGGKGKFAEIFIAIDPFRDGQRIVDRRLVRPTDGEAWEIAIQKLADSADLLAAFRQARTKSHLGLPLQSDPRNYAPEDFAALYPNQKSSDDFSFFQNSNEAINQLMNGSVINIKLPHYHGFQTSSRILTVDSRWAIEQQDWERVTQNIEAIFAFASQIGNEPIIVGDLTALAIRSIGSDLIGEVLSNHYQEFNEQQLARIQQAVERDSLVDYFDLAGERAMTMDILQRAFTDDGKGDGRVTAQGMELLQNIRDIRNSLQAELGIQDRLERTWNSVSAPLALMTTTPTRKQIVTIYDSFLQHAEVAFGTAYYKHPDWDFEIQAGDATGPIFGQFLLAIDQLHDALNLAIGNQSGTVAAIAVYRHQQKHGKLPNSLDQLVGDILDEVPLDQCNGQPLCYQTTSDGFIIYSVGLDDVDNGGTPIIVGKDNSNMRVEESNIVRARAPNFSFTGKNLKGDWVLWPRLSDLDD